MNLNSSSFTVFKTHFRTQSIEVFFFLVFSLQNSKTYRNWYFSIVACHVIFIMQNRVSFVKLCIVGIILYYCYIWLNFSKISPLVIFLHKTISAEFKLFSGRDCGIGTQLLSAACTLELLRLYFYTKSYPNEPSVRGATAFGSLYSGVPPRVHFCKRTSNLDHWLRKRTLSNF